MFFLNYLSTLHTFSNLKHCLYIEGEFNLQMPIKVLFEKPHKICIGWSFFPQDFTIPRVSPFNECQQVQTPSLN